MSETKAFRFFVIQMVLFVALGFVFGWFTSRNFYCHNPLACYAEPRP